MWGGEENFLPESDDLEAGSSTALDHCGCIQVTSSLHYTAIDLKRGKKSVSFKTLQTRGRMYKKTEDHSEDGHCNNKRVFHFDNS